MNEQTEFSMLAEPGRRALREIGCTKLALLSKLTETDIKKLHGLGPSGLKAALASKGLAFKS